ICQARQLLGSHQLSAYRLVIAAGNSMSGRGLTTHSSGRRSIACALTNLAVPAPLNSSVGRHGGAFLFIKNFGQFWRTDEVDWFPGQGNRYAFRLLGRQGTNLPNVRLADFRKQQGIYILYGNHGPHYTGLTTEQGLGKR